MLDDLSNNDVTTTHGGAYRIGIQDRHFKEDDPYYQQDERTQY